MPQFDNTFFLHVYLFLIMYSDLSAKGPGFNILKHYL